MNCFQPGRIVIGPGPEWTSGGEHRIREELGEDFEIEHDVIDVFHANDIASSEEYISFKHHLPFLARVPEGSEEEIAQKLRSVKFSRGRIKAAIPNYVVRASATIDINHQAILKAIQSAYAETASSGCGSECTVGIIDSGIDVSFLNFPGIVHRQLNAKDPLNAVSVQSDLSGHGTLVAYIINQIAPAARIIPVKAIDADGTLMDVLTALYLAHKAGPCDIINLSLSMSCDPDYCAVCNTPSDPAMNISQLKSFFQQFVDFAGDVILIAAAGNNRSHIASPAAFDNIIAVGSYHHATRNPISDYKTVPFDRYILGPDGTKTASEEFASRPALRQQKEMLYGTSFAAAFVTGVSARIVCGLKTHVCPHGSYARLVSGPNSTIRSMVLTELAYKADRNWAGFDARQHGLGQLRLY